MPVRFDPLPGGVGVEVIGLDLGDPASEASRPDVLDAFYAHHLVLVRGPELPLEDQIRFAIWFGDIAAPDPKFQRPGYAAVETYMSNVRGDFRLSDEYALHRDDVHSPSPCAAMCLHALEVTEHGGETIFVDTEAALERLEPATRARLRDLSAILIGPATRDDPTFDADQLGKGFRATGGTPETRQAQSWPAILHHPVTDAEVLYVDPATLYGFDGLDPADEEALRHEVLAVFDEPPAAYRHTWSVGDTIVWDNVSLLHARTAFPPEERRELRKLIMHAPVVATA
jgi:taurine dioxygenase